MNITILVYVFHTRTHHLAHIYRSLYVYTRVYTMGIFRATVAGVQLEDGGRTEGCMCGEQQAWWVRDCRPMLAATTQCRLPCQGHRGP